VPQRRCALAGGALTPRRAAPSQGVCFSGRTLDKAGGCCLQSDRGCNGLCFSGTCSCGQVAAPPPVAHMPAPAPAPRTCNAPRQMAPRPVQRQAQQYTQSTQQYTQTTQSSQQQQGGYRQYAPPTRTAGVQQGNGGSSPWWSG
jgi:hypothetical protein